MQDFLFSTKLIIFACIDRQQIINNMKKFGLILIAALALTAPRALAQDMFNHLALGVSVGLDGLGIEAATPMGDHFQLRAGYSIMPFGYNKAINLGSVKIGNETRSFNNVPLSVKMWQGGDGKLLADWFPGDGVFRVTAGIFAGSGKFITGNLDLSKSLRPDEYGRIGVGFEGGPSFTTDAKGVAHVDAMVFKVMPYVGIGVGRAFCDNRVTFSFDFGALVTGGIKPQSYNYIKNTLDPSKPVDVINITSASVNNKDKGWIDKISGIPVFPMLKFAVFVQLF